MLWDHRPSRNRFAGIVLQEYSHAERRLVGERRLIFQGTPIGYTEGPHLYKRGGWYYLLTAEGGTGWGHAVTLARSRSLFGPYELHPDGYLLTARDRPEAILQRAGHADLVEAEAGEPYLVHLCGRPLPNRGRCTLGRETAIQKMRWDTDGWLRTAHGDAAPQLDVPCPALPPCPWPEAPARIPFDGQLPPEFQWLRSPYPDQLFDLSSRPGWLLLPGRESLGSQFDQALVARRQQAHCCHASTIIEFEPAHFQQSAGLIHYYNGAKFHYLAVTHDETLGRVLQIFSRCSDLADFFSAPVAVPPGPLELRAEIDFERLRFAWRVPGQAWNWLPQVLDASLVSDESGPVGLPNFTGAFLGLCAQDTAGTRHPAAFAWFEYRERPYLPLLGGTMEG